MTTELALSQYTAPPERPEPLTFYTVAWGARHVDTWADVALRSLCQPGNIPALKAEGVPLRYVIFTHEDHIDEVREIGKPWLDGLCELDVRGLATGTHPVSILPGFMEELIERGEWFFLSPTDIFWGDGSIANLYHYGFGRPVVVAAGNLRVDERTFLAALEALPKEGVITNAALVGLTMSTLHEGTAQMFNTDISNATFGGGISLRQIGPRQWTMLHHLASPWLCWFNKDDVDYFRRASKFEGWDHYWPELLVRQDRLRVIGSSDLSWCAELTEPGGHFGGLRRGQWGNERFYAPLLQNLARGRVVIGLRSEPLSLANHAQCEPDPEGSVHRA